MKWETICSSLLAEIELSTKEQQTFNPAQPVLSSLCQSLCSDSFKAVFSNWAPPGESLKLSKTSKIFVYISRKHDQSGGGVFEALKGVNLE